MWGPSRQCGDDGDDMLMAGTMWGPPREQHVETTETTDLWDHMGTFWGLWGDVGMTQGQHGMMGTMWGPRGQHGDHGDNEITKNAITFERIVI